MSNNRLAFLINTARKACFAASGLVIGLFLNLLLFRTLP